MNKKFPVFDSGRDFGQEFMDYYSKDIQCPTTRLLFSWFHPVLKDHYISVNRIWFPKVNADQIVALHHDRQSKHLTEKLNFYYNTKSNERNTRERIRLSSANSFKNNSGDSSVPEIFDSFELNERSMLLEGGDNENIKSKRSRSHIKIQDQSSTIVIDSRNRINISVPPKLKGKHPKIESKNSLREKLARENENSKTFSEAVDSYGMHIYLL